MLLLYYTYMGYFGRGWSLSADNRTCQAINAIDRGMLNNTLLDELEQTPNVKLFFNHKLTGADFSTNKAWFECPTSTSHTGPTTTGHRAPEIEVSFDYLIGADGAHSATRFHLMKFARVDYQQEYIDCLWCEFRIPPSEQGDFRISPNHLHIWPGGDFMFIALPSSDRSFTCTLFAPSSQYAVLEAEPASIFEFFDRHFPGICPELITPDALKDQFASNPHLPLISLKCKPHHFGSSVVIIGDAAHAVLPFYGQGLNAGFEDVRTLFAELDRQGVYDLNRSLETRKVFRREALQAYTNQRYPDTYAINEFSKRNYLEMRSGVRSPLYKVRKAVEDAVDCYAPRLGWRTQYSRISFSNQRYSEVMRAVHTQSLVLGSLATVTICTTAVLLWRRPLTILRHVVCHLSSI